MSAQSGQPPAREANAKGIRAYLADFRGDGASVVDSEEGRLVAGIEIETKFHGATVKVGASPQRLAVGNVIASQ